MKLFSTVPTAKQAKAWGLALKRLKVHELPEKVQFMLDHAMDMGLPPPCVRWKLLDSEGHVYLGRSEWSMEPEHAHNYGHRFTSPGKAGRALFQAERKRKRFRAELENLADQRSEWAKERLENPDPPYGDLRIVPVIEIALEFSDLEEEAPCTN